MKQLKITTLLATVFAASFHLLLIDASSFSISDDRVRSLETSPALGRGYSVGANSYHQSCLMPDETNSPSYNYNYIFTDMTLSTDIETELAGKLSSSFSYTAVKTEATAVEAISNSNSDKKLFLVVSTMRVDRYFSGLKEESSPITADAKNLLEKQDYIGFFNSCGTNYVRSIRRAQEITAIFKFNSQSRDLAQEFAAGIKVHSGTSAIDESILDKKKFSLIKESLEIKVLAYGLGLNTRGESMIVSTSVGNYNNVVEFAFRSFTETIDSSNVGMVYALEFVPWVDNPSFQHESKMLDVDIELPLPRSLIPKAIADDGVTLFVNNISIRSQFSCKHLFFHIDKYGYCCDAALLFDQELGRYETEEIDVGSSIRICKPSRKLEKSVIKNNMSNNGEFVARLDSAVQKKINQLFTLEKCVASVNSMQERYGSYVLKSQGSIKYDSSVEGKVSVNQLKMALDPLGDLSLISHMGHELDEFIDMYYRPCIAALFGTNVGSSPDVEAKYFMAYGWLTHEACSKLSCLADNMRWNRNGSGCIESLITGRNAPIYDLNENECKKDDEVDPSDGSEACKYKSSDLQLYQSTLNVCWANPNPASRIPHYMMEYFCMPEIIGEKLDEEVVHPCEKIGFTNRSLRRTSNQECLYKSAGGVPVDELLSASCEEGETNQYFSLGATGEFRLTTDVDEVGSCLTDDSSTGFIACTGEDNQKIVLRTNGEITTADYVKCLDTTLSFQDCADVNTIKEVFEFSLVDFVETETETETERRLKETPTDQSIKPDDVSTGTMLDIFPLEESVSKITPKHFLRKQTTEQSLKPDDVTTEITAPEIVPLEKSISKTSEEFDDQSIKSDNISTGTMPEIFPLEESVSK